MNSESQIALQISHQVQGRVRIKVPRLKGCPAEGMALERCLAREPNIRSVSVRPITGSVIIRLDAQAIDPPRLLRRLQGLVDELESATPRQRRPKRQSA